MHIKTVTRIRLALTVLAITIFATISCSDQNTLSDTNQLFNHVNSQIMSDNIKPVFNTKIKDYTADCKIGEDIIFNISNNTLGVENYTHIQNIQSDIDNFTIGDKSFQCIPEHFPEIEHVKNGEGNASKVLTTISLNDRVTSYEGESIHYTVVLNDNAQPIFISDKLDSNRVHVQPNDYLPISYNSEITYDDYDTGEQSIKSINFSSADLQRTIQVRTIDLGHTDTHDWQMNGYDDFYLLSYSPTRRDLSRFIDEDGNNYDTREKTSDSVIQKINSNNEILFMWNSKDHIPLEDCTQHRFPVDYSHINSIEIVDGKILASLRGCSTVVMIDESSGDVLWRLGKTRMDDDFYNDSNYVKPLVIKDDPEGEFCGQHSARITKEGNLVLYDNGVHCVGERSERNPYSRVVEYRIDEDNNIAHFVRDYSLGNSRSMAYNSRGNVQIQQNGNWLVSWGRRQAQHVNEFDKDYSYTEYNPETETELMSVAFRYSGQLLVAEPWYISDELYEELRDALRD